MLQLPYKDCSTGHINERVGGAASQEQERTLHRKRHLHVPNRSLLECRDVGFRKMYGLPSLPRVDPGTYLVMRSRAQRGYGYIRHLRCPSLLDEEGKGEHAGPVMASTLGCVGSPRCSRRRCIHQCEYLALGTRLPAASTIQRLALNIA